MARTRVRAGGSAGRGRPLLRRAAAAVVVPVLLAASGCVTVHGETALVPAVDRAQAPKVLERFVTVTNRANRELDPELNATVETGVLGAMDEATLKVRRAKKPEGDPGYRPLELSDTRYLVPQLRGWPKWFVADTANNRGDDRWLLTFTRGGADEQWRASYLLVLPEDGMPSFATDEDGYAQAVAPDATGLAVPPGRLAAAYTAYLKDGEPEGSFADGPQTSQLRAAREKEKKTTRYVTLFVDEAAKEEEFAPVALRTSDGGALVLFTSRHSWQVVYAQGVPLPRADEYTETLMTGTPKRAVTRTALAEQAALVPEGGGEVRIVSRIMGIVAARGE
jgi:hypothetical protein